MKDDVLHTTAPAKAVIATARPELLERLSREPAAAVVTEDGKSIICFTGPADDETSVADALLFASANRLFDVGSEFAAMVLTWKEGGIQTMPTDTLYSYVTEKVLPVLERAVGMDDACNEEKSGQETREK
jgi:hypothetical protein